MNCQDCGAEMKTSRENYRYDESGLPYVVLSGVEVGHCPKCGLREVAIVGMDNLHGLIARMVAQKSNRLTSEEVRFLRKYLGFSSVDFAEIVGVSAETVSRWENGKQLSPIADRLIRMLAIGTLPATEYPIDCATIVERLRRIDESISQPVRI